MTLSTTAIGVTLGGRSVLDDVSVTFEPGALVGLLGPNGAGKSTFIRTMAGLVAPHHGVVTLDGRTTREIPHDAWTRMVGYVPQHFAPAWDFTVQEIVDMGARRSAVSADRYGAVVRDLELTPVLQRPWSRLSGGERARVLMAAVIVADRKIVLADEPAAGLDIRHRFDLLERLRAGVADRILVVVMHDLELAARYCDRLVVLDRVHVALDGPTADVLADPALDAVFGVAFHRVASPPNRGSLLPMPNG